MAEKTPNYEFNTPGLSGAANITVQDANWEKLDEKLKSVDDSVAAKVDKEAGKVLSSNDYTDAEKADVAKIKNIQTNLDNKASIDEVVKKEDGLPNALTLKMNGSTSTFNGTATVSKTWYAPMTAGTKGQVLKSNGNGAPEWGEIDGAMPVIIVAAGDSSAEDKAKAKYTCDGSGDEVEINAAINSLPEYGGTVYLLAGTYTTLAPIILDKNNISLVGRVDGNHKTSIIGDVENGNFSIASTSGSSKACIGISANNVLLYGLTVKGSLSPEKDSSGTVVNTITGIGMIEPSGDLKIANCSVSDWYHGIFKASYRTMPHYKDTIISNCKFSGCFAFNAIADYAGSTIIRNCFFDTITPLYNSPLISVYGSESPTVIEGNYSNSKCTFASAGLTGSCTIRNNIIDAPCTGTSEDNYHGYGIFIEGRFFNQSSKDTREPISFLVEGNAISGMRAGIYTGLSSATTDCLGSLSYCTITGNTICNCFNGISSHNEYRYRPFFLKIFGNYITNNVNCGINCCAEGSVIADNYVEKNNTGIYIISSYNNISGNLVRANTKASITVSGSYNLCVGNNLYGMNYTNSGSNSNTNTFADNKYN